MGRPAKSVKAKTGQIPKAEKEARAFLEEVSKGGTDKIVPDMKLNDNQTKIFRRIITNLKSADILSNLDSDILTTCAIAIDRLQYIEGRINEEPELIFDKDIISVKDKYTKDFFRCCNELCLSPQSRAKFSISAINKAKQEEDPLLKALSEGDDEEY